MSPAPESEQAVSEEAAWGEVLAAWRDEERHEAYLARFQDLEGLAVAGRRYRDALAERPGDAIAARFRDEVVKRAMVQGLATIPRAATPQRSRALVQLLAFAGAMGVGAAIWWIAHALGGAPGARP